MIQLIFLRKYWPRPFRVSTLNRNPTNLCSGFNASKRLRCTQRYTNAELICARLADRKSKSRIPLLNSHVSLSGTASATATYPFHRLPDTPHAYAEGSLCLHSFTCYFFSYATSRRCLVTTHEYGHRACRLWKPISHNRKKPRHPTPVCNYTR